MSRGASPRQPPRQGATARNSASNRPREAQGAQTSRRSLGDRFQSYHMHHRASLLATVRRLMQQPGQTLLTSLVVAIALALPALLLVSLNNLQQLGENWDTEPRISLYLHQGVKDAALKGLDEQLRTDTRIAGVRYISADEALAEFEQHSGFGGALNGLGHNPLPASFELRLASAFRAPEAQAELAEEYAEHALVEQAQVDLAWVQRFLAITALLRQLVVFLAILLGLGALLAIGNTVRLLIENRRDEIVVIKLVGGTDGFVRRPLLYTGGLFGFLGAFLACIIVGLVVWILSGSVEHLAQSYDAQFRMKGLGFVQALELLAVGTILGWLGAMVAVGRHLADIEPR